MRKHFQIMGYTTNSFMEKEVINDGTIEKEGIQKPNLKYKILSLVQKKKRRKSKNTLINKNSVKPTLFGPEILVMMLLIKKNIRILSIVLFTDNWNSRLFFLFQEYDLFENRKKEDTELCVPSLWI
ncbi:hypothetical protein U0070_017462, partial [Myodes glareolus]